MSAAAPVDPAVLFGKIKTFGPFGEPYEVIGLSELELDGMRAVKIRLVKTGELADYSYLHMQEDPEAQ